MASPAPTNYQNELVQWFYSVPLISRTLLSLTVSLSLLANFRIISFHTLSLTSAALRQLQIWRFVTPFFLVGLGMSFLFHLFFLYNYARGLEEGFFLGRPADFVWFLTIVAAIMNTVGLWLGMPFLTGSLLGALIYLWSQANRDSVVNFMFGLRFKGMYLPLVMIAFDMLMSRFDILMVVGMAAAHVYWYFEAVYPQLPTSQGARPLKPPQFIEKLLPPSDQRMGGFGASGETTTTQGRSQSGGGGGGHSWGRGNRLN